MVHAGRAGCIPHLMRLLLVLALMVIGQPTAIRCH